MGPRSAAFDFLQVSKGQRVLVVGGSGAVGSIVVQLAARAGAQVIATASTEATARVRALGATDVIDYKTTAVVEALAAGYPDGIDAVFDAASDTETLSAIAASVRPAGRVISIRNGADVDALADQKIEAFNLFFSATPEILTRLADLLVSGDLQLPDLTVVPLESITSTTGPGKVVLTI